MATLPFEKEKEEIQLSVEEGAAFAAGKAWNRNQKGCSDWPNCITRGCYLYKGKETARQRATEKKRLTSGHSEM